MWDQSIAPLRVSDSPMLGSVIFRMAEPPPMLSAAEIRIIRLEARLAQLEDRMLRARIARLRRRLAVWLERFGLAWSWLQDSLTVGWRGRS